MTMYKKIKTIFLLFTIITLSFFCYFFSSATEESAIGLSLLLFIFTSLFFSFSFIPLENGKFPKGAFIMNEFLNSLFFPIIVLTIFVPPIGILSFILLIEGQTYFEKNANLSHDFREREKYFKSLYSNIGDSI